jgi:hypothetical protein
VGKTFLACALGHAASHADSPAAAPPSAPGGRAPPSTAAADPLGWGDPPI